MGIQIGLIERWWAPLEKGVATDNYSILIEKLRLCQFDIAYDFALTLKKSLRIKHIDEICTFTGCKVAPVSFYNFLVKNDLLRKVPLLKNRLELTDSKEALFWDICELSILKKELLLCIKYIEKKEGVFLEKIALNKLEEGLFCSEQINPEFSDVFEKIEVNRFICELINFIELGREKKMPVFIN